MKNSLLLISILLSVFYSSAQWSQVITPITGEIEAVHMHDANTIVIASGTGILTSNDGGSSWTIALTAPIYDMSFVSQTIGFAAGDNGMVFKTTDGGNTWNQLNTNSTTKFRALHFYDANVGAAVGESGGVIVTGDGGATWSAKSSGTSVRLLTVFFTSPSTGFLAGRDGVVRKTTDGGNTWGSANVSTSDDVAAIYFSSVTNGFMAVEGGIILRTTDGGNTWSPVQTSTANDINGIYFLSNNEGYAVGFNGVIIKTLDGGTTWNNENSPVMTELAGVHFYDNNNGFAVGDLGTALKFQLGGTSVKELTAADFQIFPNPSTEFFTVKSTRQGEVKIEISDILGKSVAVFEGRLNQNYRHGIKEAGIYIMKITAKGEKPVFKRLKVS